LFSFDLLFAVRLPQDPLHPSNYRPGIHAKVVSRCPRIRDVMIAQFEGQARASSGRPPNADASEVLKVEDAIDLADVERRPEQPNTGDDVRRNRPVVPEVRASGECASSCRNGTGRLVIREQRCLAIELDSIGEEPPHLRMKGSKRDVASRLAEERTPGMAPSPRQPARAAVSVEAWCPIVRLRAGDWQMKDERQQNQAGSTPNP
jgi:hypothetical protein